MASPRSEDPRRSTNVSLHKSNIVKFKFTSRNLAPFAAMDDITSFIARGTTPGASLDPNIVYDFPDFASPQATILTSRPVMNCCMLPRMAAYTCAQAFARYPLAQPPESLVVTTTSYRVLISRGLQDGVKDDSLLPAAPSANRDGILIVPSQSQARIPGPTQNQSYHSMEEMMWLFMRRTDSVLRKLAAECE
jgi:hypothetical protein